MGFPEAEANKLLVDCKRHCCVCWRRCGFRIELHHIHPVARGGSDEIENAIPVCFDCHAEIESSGPKGRKYREAELFEHKRRWLDLVANTPGALIEASQRQSETGPLEALYAELEYNLTIAIGPATEGFPPFATRQFDRAIATNALSTLANDMRSRLLVAYAAMNRVNYHLQELAAMDRTGGRGGAFAATREVANTLRSDLARSLPDRIFDIGSVLGREPGSQ